MATANFKTMANFPLIVMADTPSCRICPECGCTNGTDEDKCVDCGCDISSVDWECDNFALDDMAVEMKTFADNITNSQDFFKVSVVSGYYCGLQYLVEEKCDFKYFDNHDSNYYFGMCRSAMLRKAAVAENKVRKGLFKAKDDLGLIELVCVGVFSNGEAIYSKVDTRKPLPLKVAVKAAMCA